MSTFSHGLLFGCLAVTAHAQQFASQRIGVPFEFGYTSAAAFGDVDGDGDPDLVLANSANFIIPPSNQLLLNDGNGGFTPAPVGAFPRDRLPSTGVTLVDLDGDGDLDALFGNAPITVGSVPTLTFYRNDGRGRFSDVTSTSFPNLRQVASSVDVADVDGDKDLDIVIGQFALVLGTCRLLLNDGSGRFSDASSRLAPSGLLNILRFADIDGDGDSDIVSQGSLEIWVNDGKGNFRNDPSRVPFQRSAAIGIADLDGDRDLDLVIGNTVNPTSIDATLLLNDGRGVFRELPGRLPKNDGIDDGFVIVDIDLDGDLDLLTPTRLRNIKLWRHDGNLRFRSDAMFPPAYANAVATSDVDLDGDLDLFTSHVLVFGPGPNLLSFNLHRHVAAAAAPRVGQNHELQAWSRPGYGTGATVGIPLVDTRPLTPKLATPFGLLGVGPASAALLTPLAISTPSGFARLSLRIPNDPNLRGQSLVTQLLVAGSTQAPRLTNTWIDRIR